MYIKQSIECWVLDPAQKKALLLRVPQQAGQGAFNQPITGGIEAGETPEEACLREVFEETGLRLTHADIQCLKRDFKVIVDEAFQLNKFVFVCRTQLFAPTLSATEHESYQWAPFADVPALLTYPSNLQTWQWACPQN